MPNKKEQAAIDSGAEFSDHVAKNPTPTQSRFADWLRDKTGYGVDLTSVRLAMSLQSAYRADPEVQSERDERKAEAARSRDARRAAQAEKAQARIDKLEARLQAEREKLADKVPTVEVEESDDEFVMAEDYEVPEEAEESEDEEEFDDEDEDDDWTDGA